MIKILLIVLLPFIVLSQTQICDEDFEGVTPGEIPRYDPTGSGEISECARTLYTHEGLAPADTGEFLASGGNPGQCAQAYLGPNISGYGYSEPKWRFDNTIGGSSTIYIKFDLKIDANLGTSNGTREITDFKVIRITDHTDASTASSNQWHPQLQAEPSDGSYSWYTWSQTGANQEYYFSRATTKLTNHLMDNNWHTMEIFIDIGTGVCDQGRDDPDADGIVRVWEDGILILEDETVPMRGVGEGAEINSLAFMRHAFAVGAPVSPMSGNLYYDNMEVWDDYSVSTSTNVRIVPGGTGYILQGTNGKIY